MKFCEWKINGFDRDAAVALCRRGINPLASVFLTSRGVTDEQEALARLTDDNSAIYDALTLRDMDKAVAHIEEAVRSGDKIAIYGDYDVDGMTASALLACCLREHGREPEIYIPERMEEGYGLNIPALDALLERGIGLVITVDCGITAISEAKYARERGLKLIITDHHECKDELPEALAVINPKRPDCPYPNKSLAGVGVAFKLACALSGGKTLDALLDKYSDLVAIGTVADVMPVTGENRALIRRGLELLNNSARPGLRRLMDQSCAPPRRITSATIGFVLAPRLNAAGRMGRTPLSVELLLTENAADADRLTAELCRLNDERRALESEIFDEAEAMLGGEDPKGPIILARHGWYQGVMGIVAARLSERNLFPAVLISIDEDGSGRGSCRSFGRFSMYGALRECEDLLQSYGGHEMAAGLTVAEENIPELARRIQKYYHEQIKIAPVPTLIVDFEVTRPELLTPQNIEALTVLEPFGNGNPPPRMCILGAALTSVFGVGGGRHTRIKIEKSGRALDGIFFGVPPDNTGVREGDAVDVAFEPQLNEFRGKTNVQMHIADIRAHR